MVNFSVITLVALWCVSWITLVCARDYYSHHQKEELIDQELRQTMNNLEDEQNLSVLTFLTNITNLISSNWGTNATEHPTFKLPPGTTIIEAFSEQQEGDFITSYQNVTFIFPDVGNTGATKNVTIQLPMGSKLADAFPFITPTSSPSSTVSVSPTFSPTMSPSPSPSASFSVSPSSSPSVSVAVSPIGSVSVFPLPSTSVGSDLSTCISGCRCENPGELLGDQSFTESELDNIGNTIWSAADWDISVLSPGVFRSDWDPGLVSYDGDELTLTAEKRGEDLFGAEIRTSTYYGYGCVSACMKPSSVSGVISSLFTYTGRLDGINGSTPNQNEIDIEFEGENTGQVQFNYHTDRPNGAASQNNEIKYTLGFDASADFNVYGFRWTPWGIEWEVNGNVVTQIDNTGGLETPVVTADTVQKVMANIWIVATDIENSFGGPFDESSFSKTSASYKWIRYGKLDSDGCCTIAGTC